MLDTKKQSRLWGLKWAEGMEKQVSDSLHRRREDGNVATGDFFFFLSSQYFHLCRYPALLAVDESRVPAWAKRPLHWAFTGVTDSFGFVFVLESRPDSGERSPVDGTFVSTATWDTRSKNVFLSTWSRHSISTCSVYTEHYGNFRASKRDRIAFNCTSFQFQIFGNISRCQFIIPRLAGSTPPYDAPQSISEKSDVADTNKAIPKILIIFIPKSSRYRQFECQKKKIQSAAKKKKNRLNLKQPLTMLPSPCWISIFSVCLNNTVGMRLHHDLGSTAGATTPGNGGKCQQHTSRCFDGCHGNWFHGKKSPRLKRWNADGRIVCRWIIVPCCCCCFCKGICSSYC